MTEPNLVAVLADTAAERGEGVLKFLGILLLIALSGMVFFGGLAVLARGVGMVQNVIVDHQIVTFGAIAVGGLVGYVFIGWIAGAIAAGLGFLAFVLVMNE